jgi:hypothetical protein
MRACLFCSSEHAKLSGEHIWDDWLFKNLPPRGVEHFRTTPEDPIGTKWRSDRIDAKVKAVCESCNNGWMSELAGEAKLTLEGMIRQCRPTCILPFGCQVIACFSFVKAAIMDSSVNRAPTFPALTRKDFFDSVQLPRGAQLWLSVFMASPALAAVTYSSRLQIKAGELKGFEYHVFTYTIGHVICQLTFPWHSKRRQRRRAPVLHQNPIWDSCSLPAWPDIDRVIWPPRQFLRGDNVLRFHRRWEGITGLK